MSTETEKKIGIAEYSETEAALASLRDRFGPTVVWDVSTTKGLDAAKQARLEIKTLRTALEKKRVELKAPILERGKLLDDECKRITALLVELEYPIDKIIKDEEARKERIKEERAKAEKARIDAIRAKIDVIRNKPVQLVGSTSDVLRRELDAMVDPVSNADEYAEFATEAGLAHKAATEALGKMLEAAVTAEAEAKRLQEESDRLAEEQRKLDAQAEAQRLQQEEIERQQKANQEAAAPAPVAAEVAPAIAAPATSPVPAAVETVVTTPSVTTTAVAQAPARPSDSDLASVIAHHFAVSEETAHAWLSTYNIQKAA